MTDLTQAIRDIVREELSAFTSSDEPEMITTDEAAELLKCGKEVILNLHKDRESGFPSVQLGPRVSNAGLHALGL